MKRYSLLALILFTLLLAACTVSQTTTDVPSTGLASYQVVDQQGDVVARVEDVLIAADSSQISFAVVILRRDPFSYGKAAFTEAAVPRTAVPWNYVSLDSTSQQLQLKVDSATLYAAPRLRNKPDRLESDWDSAIQAYWQTYAISGKQE